MFDMTVSLPAPRTHQQQQQHPFLGAGHSASHTHPRPDATSREAAARAPLRPFHENNTRLHHQQSSRPLITLPGNTNGTRTAVLTAKTSANPTNPILQACVRAWGCCTATPGLRAAIARHLPRSRRSSAAGPAKSSGMRRGIERCRRGKAARKHTVSKTTLYPRFLPTPPFPSFPMACQHVP